MQAMDSASAPVGPRSVTGHYQTLIKMMSKAASQSHLLHDMQGMQVWNWEASVLGGS